MTRTKTLELEIKTAPSDGSGTWTGLAATFSKIPDFQNDVIQPGAFATSIRDWQRRFDFPPVFFNHDAHRPDGKIGKLTSMQEIDAGLLVSGKLNLQSDLAVKTYEAMLTGALDSMSIGYGVRREHMRADGINSLDVLDIIEVSLATVPANPEARVLSVKSYSGDDGRDGQVEVAAFRKRLDALDPPVTDADLKRQLRALDPDFAIREVARLVALEDARLRKIGEKLAQTQVLGGTPIPNTITMVTSGAVVVESGETVRLQAVYVEPSEWHHDEEADPRQHPHGG